MDSRPTPSAPSPAPNPHPTSTPSGRGAELLAAAVLEVTAEALRDPPRTWGALFDHLALVHRIALEATLTGRGEPSRAARLGALVRGLSGAVGALEDIAAQEGHVSRLFHRARALRVAFSNLDDALSEEGLYSCS